VHSLFRQYIVLLCLIVAFSTAAFSAHAVETDLVKDTVQNTQTQNDNKSVLSLFTDEEETFLSPDQAFQVKLDVVNAKTIRASYTIAPGYYLYRERIKFSITGRPDAGKVVSVNLPTGEIKNDPNFGRQEVYHHDFKADVIVDAVNQDLSIETGYQGCSDQGLCYAPIKKIFEVDLSKPTAFDSTANANSSSNSDDALTTGLLKGGDLWLIIAGFFGAGLLLSLTPCVLPMIPILSSIIVGQQTNQQPISKLQSFGLSVAYVIGMALSYTLAGIAAGLSGNLLSQSLQNPWVLGSFALIFVVLACSMFGLYELRLPSAFENKVLNASNRFKGGKFFGVFIMGALSALIVSPCVAAPLAGALIYIGQSQDVVLGGVALFALSLGMGVPLLIIGASAGSILPRTGNWMNAVRNFFGVLMLAMAIWLISPVMPSGVVMALWAVLIIMTAIYMKALDALPPRASGFVRFCKGFAIILLIWGITLLVGALSGATSIWQPLSGITSSKVEAISKLSFKRITSSADLDKVLADAKGQPVMLDFYADWCVACKEMEAFTFSNSQVQERLKETLVLQADVTANSAEDIALLKRFGLYGPPGIIFFNKQGEEIATTRIVGYQDVAKFNTTLDQRDQHL
jgi:thiol:disulfide interchange protein DsbD